MLLALVLPVHDFMRVAMHLFWKCVGLGLGLGIGWHCLVSIN